VLGVFVEQGANPGWRFEAREAIESPEQACDDLLRPKLRWLMSEREREQSGVYDNVKRQATATQQRAVEDQRVLDRPFSRPVLSMNIGELKAWLQVMAILVAFLFGFALSYYKARATYEEVLSLQLKTVSLDSNILELRMEVSRLDGELAIIAGREAQSQLGQHPPAKKE
jgi:hypothetical protein